MKFFTFSEFEQSLTASLCGFDNEAPGDARRNIEYFVNSLLDPLREAMDFPLIITSGYRCSEVNRSIGGSPTSQHLLGLAADFRPNYTSTEQMAERMAKIRRWFKDKLEARAYTLQLEQDWVGEEWDQLIDYGKFFHVGVRPEGSTNRFQMMKWNSYGQGYRKD